MLCGRFVLSPLHDRFLRAYLPTHVVVHAAEHSAALARPGTGAQLAALVSLMRNESAAENLGARAMLNALSTALFALTLRLASETAEAPTGLLAIVSHPRLAPALAAMFNDPAHAWSLPELARLCHMSRATLARHFQDRLGRSASDLLTDIRMTLATTTNCASPGCPQRPCRRRWGISPRPPFSASSRNAWLDTSALAPRSRIELNRRRDLLSRGTSSSWRQGAHCLSLSVTG
jgi:hypothetical protein